MPNIDMLINPTTTNSKFSFMVGSSGYNQLKMHPLNAEKTVFKTPMANFISVMLFRFKNTGATYQ